MRNNRDENENEDEDKDEDEDNCKSIEEEEEEVKGRIKDIHKQTTSKQKWNPPMTPK